MKLRLHMMGFNRKVRKVRKDWTATEGGFLTRSREVAKSVLGVDACGTGQQIPDFPEFQIKMVKL